MSGPFGIAVFKKFERMRAQFALAHDLLTYEDSVRLSEILMLISEIVGPLLSMEEVVAVTPYDHQDSPYFVARGLVATIKNG